MSLPFRKVSNSREVNCEPLSEINYFGLSSLLKTVDRSMITAAEVAWEAKAIFDHLLKYSMSDEIFFFEIRSKQG